jgi:hypothetical protein
MTRLTLVIVVLFASLFATIGQSFAASVDSVPATLSNKYHITFEDLSECNLFHLTVNSTNQHSTICLDPTDSPNIDNGAVLVSFTKPYTNSNEYWYGTVTQVIDETEYTYPFLQGSWTIPTFPVIVSISGQNGDSAYDQFVATYPLCTVLAVIDDGNDALSPFIYTRLSCDMTQATIDNLPEQFDGILLITPRYTVNVPIVRN